MFKWCTLQFSLERILILYYRTVFVNGSGIIWKYNVNKYINCISNEPLKPQMDLKWIMDWSFVMVYYYPNSGVVVRVSG